MVDPGKSPCELGTSRYFNIVLQPPYYLSKHPDFVVSIPAGDQQICRIPQCLLAAFGRSSQDGIV
jgi:hypothetical protein